jgi:hypothetical protein
MVAHSCRANSTHQKRTPKILIQSIAKLCVIFTFKDCKIMKPPWGKRYADWTDDKNGARPAMENGAMLGARRATDSLSDRGSPDREIAGTVPSSKHPSFRFSFNISFYPNFFLAFVGGQHRKRRTLGIQIGTSPPATR